MWHKLGKFILKNRILLVVLLLLATAFMGWKATSVKMGYEFAKAVPTDNPHYQEYVKFQETFGADASMFVIGVSDPKFFTKEHFDAYRGMISGIQKVPHVKAIISVPNAINLTKNDSTEKLVTSILFDSTVTSQVQIDSAAAIFKNLMFYRGLLHNPEKQIYLAGITIDPKILNTKHRTEPVNAILELIEQYKARSNVDTHISGLPYIRTVLTEKIKKEMNLFLYGSLLLAMVTLILFFRSISATLLSMFVVVLGVVWCVGTMVLFGYDITLLTALIPPLIIVIGIPNCIYFLNKYHMSWEENAHIADIKERKKQSIINMVGRMGVVTLFCNIAAAVGFYVFSFTASPLLKEFGNVAGINIMVLFIISLILIPVVLYYLPAPKPFQTRYLRNKLLEKVLVKIEHWVLHRKALVYTITAAMLVFSIIGFSKLKSVGYIVDDMPKEEQIYVDLKWFEKNFGGVMPLEVVVDTKKKGGITRGVKAINKINEFSAYLDSLPETARSLSLVEGLKFVTQAFQDGDTTKYVVPSMTELVFMEPYLKGANNMDTSSQFAKIVKNFADSTKQRARISVNMADIGSDKLPVFLNNLQKRANEIFDTAQYNVTFTGGPVNFLEGSRFIINGLQESILWAFGLIAICMLYLFKSFRILVCSLVPNIIPLLVTAGLMGWAGVPLKPSTVLVFSVALGIAIDVTIRFLVNYKQELPDHNNEVLPTILSTIKHTGISIIYTSLVLIAGFVIFMFSKFGGTFGLGWLTSFTLLVATFTNLVFLPVFMIAILKSKTKTKK